MISWRNIVQPSCLTLTEADSPRLVLCDACGSEGCGRSLDPDDGTCACRYRGYSGDKPIDCPDACPYCEGTGGELIATEPVTMEDLAMILDEQETPDLEAQRRIDNTRETRAWGEQIEKQDREALVTARKARQWRRAVRAAVRSQPV